MKISGYDVSKGKKIALGLSNWIFIDLERSEFEIVSDTENDRIIIRALHGRLRIMPVADNSIVIYQEEI